MFLSEIKKKLSNNFLTNGIETPELDARLVLKEVLSFDDKDLILKQNLRRKNSSQKFGCSNNDSSKSNT